MKILHTSDWHIGKIFHEKSLLEDQKHVLSQIHDIIKKDPHDSLIIAGDLYDRSLPSAEAVQLLSWFLTELRSFSDIPVIIISGNHDSRARLSYCSELMTLTSVYFKTDPFLVDVPVTIHSKDQTADIFAIPFLEPSVYNIHNEDEESVQKSHEQAVEKGIELILKNIRPENITIITGHLYARGGLTSDSERKFIGTAGDVDSSLFDQFDYTALGHLHKPQAVNKQTYYSGSPLKYSFSESEDSKHLLSVDVDKSKLKVTSIPLLPLREMSKISGKFMDLLNSPEYDSFKNHYIEAELLDPSLITNPMAILRDRFPYILSVRQKASALRNSENNRPEITQSNRSIETDFISFHEYLYGEKPQHDRMLLLNTLRKEGKEI